MQIMAVLETSLFSAEVCVEWVQAADTRRTSKWFLTSLSYCVIVWAKKKKGKKEKILSDLWSALQSQKKKTEK